MLYIREARLIVGSKEFVTPDFTIYFRVHFDEDEDANDARIEAYNLSKDSENSLRQGTPVILSAGYEGDVGTIFQGVIDDVSIDKQQANRIATIECTDRELFKDVRINKSYKEGIKASQIIRDIISITGFDVGDFDLPTDKEYRKGKSIDTSAKNALSEIAKDCGAKFHYNKGRLYMRPKGKGDITGIFVDKEHGLVDTPERLEDEEDTGWNIKMLLNHLVTTDVMLQVQSRTANGKFRVRKGEHIKDRNRFITHVEAVE